MSSRDTRKTGVARVALELVLGACTLWLLLQNAALMLVLSQHADRLGVPRAFELGLLVIGAVARALWPWPAMGFLALLLVSVLAIAALVRRDSGEARHA